MVVTRQSLKTTELKLKKKASIRRRSPTTPPAPVKKRHNNGIPDPSAKAIPSPISSGKWRTLAALIRSENKKSKLRAAYFGKQVQVIKVPFTLAELQASKPAEKELKSICKDLSKQEPQCISAKFVDANGEPILVYYGCRRSKTFHKQPKEIELAQQYKGRTPSSVEGKKLTFDGLHARANKCELLRIAIQKVVRTIPMDSKKDNARHKPQPFHYYKVEGSDEEHREDSRVFHLVHCWTQQGHKDGGLFISGNISKSSTTFQAVQQFFLMTKRITKSIAIMFKEAFPKYYREYKAVFDAGVWIEEDTGPFLGHALIYKLQGRLHKDGNDVGPSVSFAVGDYDGGEMLFPQLGTKLRYEAGAVCIFFSSILYHKVAPFTTKPQTALQKQHSIAPGRIGSVYFCPKNSFEVLKGKPAGWGKQTNYGRNEGLGSEPK